MDEPAGVLLDVDAGNTGNDLGSIGLFTQVSIAALLMTGRAPGSPRQTGQVCVFGGALEYSAEQEQYILLLVKTWA
jgi:hypothetical protein